ncbi:50S ribosomal protein L15 [Candidatus Dojkabacteria bacterium]|nr:50S ribosomal protein L15 [Candidatus Dojkabacteria bacterium]
MSILAEVSFKGNPLQKKKRLGRGYGSGKGGHTVGRGQKGQKSRGKRKVRLGFTGGQVSLHERLPHYRGITRRNIGVRRSTKTVNVSQIETHFKTGDIVNKAALINKRLVRKTELVKILGNGDLKKKVKVINLNVSLSAKEKIEKAGGEVINEG